MVVQPNTVVSELDGDAVVPEGEPALVVLLIPVGGAVVGLGQQAQGEQLLPGDAGDAGEIQGFSISLLRLDDQLKELLDAPADTPAWK